MYLAKLIFSIFLISVAIISIEDVEAETIEVVGLEKYNDFVLNEGDILIIPANTAAGLSGEVTIHGEIRNEGTLHFGGFNYPLAVNSTNYGTIINNGEIQNEGNLFNHGIFENTGNFITVISSGGADTSGIINYGQINNSGTLQHKITDNHNYGTIDNYGQIIYGASDATRGEFTNHEDGILNNLEQGRIIIHGVKFSGATNFHNNNIINIGNDAVVDNYSRIVNTGTINNDGLFNNYNNVRVYDNFQDQNLITHDSQVQNNGIVNKNCNGEFTNIENIVGNEITDICDDIVPQIIVPPDMTIEAKGPNGSKVTFDVPLVSDNMDPNPALTCDHNSGDTFVIGTTSVTCTATDSSGNQSIVSFDVTVRDTTPPQVHTSGDLHLFLSDDEGSGIDYPEPTATDTVGVVSGPTCTPNKDHIFQIDSSTEVRCIASDAAGNVGESSFIITVEKSESEITDLDDDGIPDDDDACPLEPENFNGFEDSDGCPDVDPEDEMILVGEPNIDPKDEKNSIDEPDTTPPVITVPGTITKEATGENGTEVYFKIEATDNVKVTQGPTCDHESGSVFPIGETIVTCTAGDAAGNMDEKLFIIVILPPPDTTPPVITVPGTITKEATGENGAVVEFKVTATDNVGITQGPTCDHESGSMFPIDTTKITCVALDSSDNSGEESFTVIVQDTTPPVITVPGTITKEATGENGAVVEFKVTATDNVGITQGPTCDHESGSMFPIQDTMVMCAAKDAQGNMKTASFVIKIIPDESTPPSPPIELILIIIVSVIIYLAVAYKSRRWPFQKWNNVDIKDIK